MILAVENYRESLSLRVEFVPEWGHFKIVEGIDANKWSVQLEWQKVSQTYLDNQDQ